MTPDFQIIANGADATAAFRDRLLSIEVVDEDGDKADRVAIQVDNRGTRIALPARDTRLEVWLGWRGASLSLMGVYAVDALSGEGPLQTLTIGATAADMKGLIRTPRTRAWEGATLGGIAREIAASAGLKPLVAADLADIAWDYLAQTAESDLHFLSRLARGLDATAKPAGGHLVVQRRGAGTTAAGDPMPDLALTPAELSRWDWQIDWREPADGYEAEYTDPDSGSRGAITTGEGRTVTRLRHVHGSKDEARRAAEAAKRRSDAEGLTLSAELAGFFPDAVAGGRATLTGLMPGLDGAWAITRATHRMGGEALSTAIEATRGAPND